jgi:hypothetical protein
MVIYGFIIRNVTIKTRLPLEAANFTLNATRHGPLHHLFSAAIHTRERKVVKYQEGKAGGKERGLRGTKAGSVERAACPVHVPGEDAPAQIQFSDVAEIQFPDLAEISRSSKGAP